jgi:hypothetical protein
MHSIRRRSFHTRSLPPHLEDDGMFTACRAEFITDMQKVARGGNLILLSEYSVFPVGVIPTNQWCGNEFPAAHRCREWC